MSPCDMKHYVLTSTLTMFFVAIKFINNHVCLDCKCSKAKEKDETPKETLTRDMSCSKTGQSMG